MVIEFPGHKCKKNSLGPHFYTNLGGSLWRCKFCWACVWIPSNFEQARIFSINIKILGVQAAYDKMMRYRPKALELLKKLEDIRKIKDVLPTEQFLAMVATIINSDAYKAAIEQEQDIIFPNRTFTRSKSPIKQSNARKEVI